MREKMKLSKMSWTVRVEECGSENKPIWIWEMWHGSIIIANDKEFKTKLGCKRNFERFAKVNGITKFKYVC